jgi:hypothetical protein
MADDTPAKVWSDQRDIPIYLGDTGDGFRVPGKDKWRAPDLYAALIGFAITLSWATFDLQSGGTDGLSILLVGTMATVLVVLALSKLPAVRPSLRTRLTWLLADLRPQLSCSRSATRTRTEHSHGR